MSNEAKNFDAFIDEINISNYQCQQLFETGKVREKPFASWLGKMSRRAQCDMENISPSQNTQLVEALIEIDFGAMPGATADEKFIGTVIDMAVRQVVRLPPHPEPRSDADRSRR